MFVYIYRKDLLKMIRKNTNRYINIRLSKFPRVYIAFILKKNVKFIEIYLLDKTRIIKISVIKEKIFYIR